MKFLVYKNGQVDQSFKPVGACLFGNDRVAVKRAEISCDKGILECRKPRAEAAALSLVWSPNGFGPHVLPTTCLPERERPYLLNLELARAKLMQIVQKREDWLLLGSFKGGDKFFDAQQCFIQAIQKIEDMSTASRLADESLRRAMLFSEALAEKQAELLVMSKGRNRGFGRGCFACNIEPERVTEAKYIEKMADLFGFVTIPMNWAQIEPKKGEYNFRAIDFCVESLSGRRLAISGGPLLRFSQDALPEWLLNTNMSFEQIREAAYDFVFHVVRRYMGSIRMWRVVSGLNAINCFDFNYEQIIEITRGATLAVKAASDRVIKAVEIAYPWGEYYASQHNTVPPIVYMDMILQAGIAVDMFGLQMHFCDDHYATHMRDMMQISSMLDTFSAVSKPFYLADVAVPSAPVPVAADLPEACSANWDEQHQQRWMERIFKIALSKPMVDSVICARLADLSDDSFDAIGLLDKKLAPKKSYLALKKMRDMIFKQ